jgi:hypothetical protein
MNIFELVKMLIIENTLYKVNNIFNNERMIDRDEELYSAISEAVLLSFDIGKNDSSDIVYPDERLM